MVPALIGPASTRLPPAGPVKLLFAAYPSIAPIVLAAPASSERLLPVRVGRFRIAPTGDTVTGPVDCTSSVATGVGKVITPSTVIPLAVATTVPFTVAPPIRSVGAFTAARAVAGIARPPAPSRC